MGNRYDGKARSTRRMDIIGDFGTISVTTAADIVASTATFAMPDGRVRSSGRA